MGFVDVRAKKALMYGNGSDLENAVNWLTDHQARHTHTQIQTISFFRCDSLLKYIR